MRVHGRNGRLYVGVASSTSAAEPLAYTSKWSFDISTDVVEVTVNGDANKVYASRKPEISGTFSGFYDDASNQTYTAASDGAARRFYLYPKRPTGGGPYFFGTATFDFKAEDPIDGAVTVSGDWWPDTAFWFVGVDGAFSDGFSSAFDGGFGL